MATLNISEGCIYNIIKSLNPNKSHCWSGILIESDSITQYTVRQYHTSPQKKVGRN